MIYLLRGNTSESAWSSVDLTSDDVKTWIVLRANSEIDARQLAGIESGDEGRGVWEDTRYSSCITIPPLGPTCVIGASDGTKGPL